MIIIGIDPGVTGACAGLNETHRAYVGLPRVSLVHEPWVFDLPIIQRRTSKWLDAREFVKQLSVHGVPHVAYVEQTHAMPQNGSKSANVSGLMLGSIIATLQLQGIPVELISPMAWKKHCGLLAPSSSTMQQRKQLSLDAARLKFPSVRLDRQKDHNRAEALMIASFGLAQVAHTINRPQTPAQAHHT